MGYYAFGMRDAELAPVELANVISKGGKKNSDYILSVAEKSHEDTDYIAAAFVFSDIQDSGYYNICADKVYYQSIVNLSKRINSLQWKEKFDAEITNMCS